MPKIDAARTIGRFSFSEVWSALAGEGVFEAEGALVPLVDVDVVIDVVSFAVVDVLANGVCTAFVFVDVGSAVGGFCPPINASHSAAAGEYSSWPVHLSHL